jgi:hypothetical protein
MDTRRIVVGTLVGGVTMYVLGYLIFEMAFGTFYAANVGSATGVIREAPLQWAVALGSLALAALVTLGIESRSGDVTIGKGIATGATVGFLLWFGVDFLRYGGSNVPNLTRTIVDPLLEIVRNGATGAAIAGALAQVGRRAGTPARRAKVGVGV